MDMKGKTALVSGSTDGVGRMVAERLAGQGARVLIHGRNAERGKEVVAAIEAQGGTAEFIAADLSSLDEVRRLAGAVRGKADRLDLLVNNAGIGAGGDGANRQESPDGLEMRFAVNYLAGFLLTAELLPLVKASAPARIVNVASAGQQAIDFDDVMLEKSYDGWRAYSQSKLAQIMFTIDLAEELEGTGVTVNCLHPATFMDTTMVREWDINPHSTVEEGADAIMNLATDDGLDGRTGLYFNGLREARADGQAYDAEARDKLRKLSAELTGAPADLGAWAA